MVAGKRSDNVPAHGADEEGGDSEPSAREQQTSERGKHKDAVTAARDGSKGWPYLLFL